MTDRADAIEPALQDFNRAWRSDGELHPVAPRGEREGETRTRIEMIFRYPMAARLAGRIFL